MSERKTLIFGNGLGMALDAQFFQLDRSIRQVWADPDVLSGQEKDLIHRCLASVDKAVPVSEDDLEHLQLALDACITLQSLPRGAEGWLTDQAAGFPTAVRNFLHAVAHGFLSDGYALPADFVRPLVDFIQATKSHVATLNYDCLLYQAMLDGGVLQPTYAKTKLVDGMQDVAGFRSENLERKWGNDFGYYLHLHGSPLYVEDEESDPSKIYKLQRTSVQQKMSGAGRHIVLTHFKHKPSVIDRSAVLKAYWDTLAEAIQESCEVLLVGCSGLDEHLNRLIKSAAQTRIRVVEWSGPDDAPRPRIGQEDFWRQRLIRTGSPRDLQLIQLPNILTFTDWAVTSPSVPEPQY